MNTGPAAAARQSTEDDTTTKAVLSDCPTVQEWHIGSQQAGKESIGSAKCTGRVCGLRRLAMLWVRLTDSSVFAAAFMSPSCYAPTHQP